MHAVSQSQWGEKTPQMADKSAREENIGRLYFDSYPRIVEFPLP